MWRWAKNFFSWDTYNDTVKDDTNKNEAKETLNQQIANWNINRNTTTNNTNTAITTSGFSSLQQKLREQQDQTPTVNTMNTSVAIEDKEDETWLDKLWNFFTWVNKDAHDIAESMNTWINKFFNWIENSRKAKADYNNQEEMYAIGYDPDNRNVYYLDLNESRGLFDWDFWTRKWTRDEFERLLNETDEKYNMPGATELDKVQAYQDFYDKAKHLFRIRADDRYTDWLYWQTAYGRRDEMYTQDELNMLANNWHTEKMNDYEPTMEEFQDFVAMYLRNKQTEQELWIQYSGLTEEEQAEQFELSNIQSDWMQKNSDIAMKWIEEYFAPMETVNPKAAMDAKLTYRSSVLTDQLWRWYNHVAPIYRAEQEILSRDQSTWSRQDRYVLWQAEKARQMDKAFAENINEVLRQTLLYWTDKKWNIVNTPDMFENGESLNDVLTKNLRELAGEDEHRYSEHQSPIDIIQNFANETAYIYKQDKDWPIKKAWNAFEYFLEPVGSTLWEAWQAAWALWMDIVWGVSMGLLYDWLTKSYMDQDATVFRLLETDDSNIGRTIKKYYLDVTEYTPEVLWNLVPDIAAFALTGPGGFTTLAKDIWNVSRLYKATKAAEWASLLNKFRVVTWLAKWEKAAEALWMTKNAYSTIINAAKAAKGTKNAQTIKTAAELVDRFVTQVWMWQIMDAQWSAFDTEPYSEASFLMSVIGSGLFDAMPEIVRWVTWRGWRKLLTGKDGGNIWSLARYIDSSPEAAENIAKMLRKGSWEIWLDDLKNFARSYWAIEEAAKQAFNNLTPAEKEAIGKMTKDLTYSYVSQALGANSTMGKRIRQILQNKNTNIADAIKYLWNIPGQVSVWPYVSTIKFKNWTRANVYTKNTLWEYDPLLDSAFNWGFSSRVEKGFSQADLDALSELNWYKNIEKNKSKWFTEVTDDNWNTTYYLTKEWLNRFWLKAESMTLESLWVTLKEAENTREALMKAKWVKSVNLSEDTIDYIANTWAYDEITWKVRELLWC